MHARVRFPPSTPSRAQGVLGCTLARQVGGAGSIPAGRSNARVANRHRHRPSKPARRVRFPPRAQMFLAGRVGTRAGLISRTPSVRFRPLQRGRPLAAALVNRPRKGPTSEEHRLDKPEAVGAGRGQQPLEQQPSKARWQTACRTSASRRSSGGTTVVRCLSSVDGDVPGPYPGEDRSSRSRGSRYQGGEAATQAPVKRPTAGSSPAPGALDNCPHRLAGQGRRPLKAETRVRIPVGTPARVDQQRGRHSFKVETAGQHRPRVRARVQWMDRSSSKRVPRRFESCRAHTPPRSDWTDAALRTRRLEVRILSGVRDASVVQQKNAGDNQVQNPGRVRTSREGLRRASTPAPTRSPETRVRLPPLAPRDPCSRKHLVRLPGCLPGEAGSIPVGGANLAKAPLVRAAAL